MTWLKQEVSTGPSRFSIVVSLCGFSSVLVFQWLAVSSLCSCRFQLGPPQRNTGQTHTHAFRFMSSAALGAPLKPRKKNKKHKNNNK